MSVLVKQALGHIHHELGKNLPSEIDPLWVVNAAGSELVNMRSWAWQQRPTTALHLRAGISYVELPADFASLVALYATDETLSHAKLVSLEELTYRKATQSNYTDNIIRYLALAHAPNDARGGGPPVARLEVFGTPSTTALSALQMLYRGRWGTVTESSDYLPMDESCDLLYVEILRAVAQGLQKGHEATVSRRLEEIRRGATFANAAGFDIRRQADTPVFRMRGAVPIWPVPRITA